MRAVSVCLDRGRVDMARWYVVCIAYRMLSTLTAPDLTLLFLGVVVSLGTAFVWLLWEGERRFAKPDRNSDRFS